MKTVLITGILGFIGRNLKQALSRHPDVNIMGYDIGNTTKELKDGVLSADVIFHLAGVNRPEKKEEFDQGNTELTQQICELLEQSDKRPLFVFSSSTQAEHDNPYGRSKRKAEEAIIDSAKRSSLMARIYRLPGVFGKWCQPNYNSVVATFCHNIARDIPIQISDPNKEISLVHVNDVVTAFLNDMEKPPTPGMTWGEVSPVFQITLGELVDMLYSYRLSRKTLLIPDFSDPLTCRLYSTFQSYLPEDSLMYDLEVKTDHRGSLAELLKTKSHGQIFVSRTKPGITRGNHYHDLKVEKFCVLEGDAIIRFRPILGSDIMEYKISGKEFCVVDIPPGHTHSIENIGTSEMIVLFWANEVFNPDTPDTYALEVISEKV